MNGSTRSASLGNCSAIVKRLPVFKSSRRGDSREVVRWHVFDALRLLLEAQPSLVNVLSFRNFPDFPSPIFPRGGWRMRREASATLVAFRSWLPLLQRINHAHITIALAVCQVFGIEHFGSAALCRLHDERIPE